MEDLFRAIDKHGRLIDFTLAEGATRGRRIVFLAKAVRTMRHWPLSSITTDRFGFYPEAIRRLQQEGKVSAHTKHPTRKYLNNITEARSWRTQASYSFESSLSKNEDSSRYDQGASK